MTCSGSLVDDLSPFQHSFHNCALDPLRPIANAFQFHKQFHVLNIFRIMIELYVLLHQEIIQ